MIWWQDEEHMYGRIPTGGRLPPTSFVGAVIHGVKLGIADGMSEMLFQSQREHADAGHPIRARVLGNVGTALSRWWFWNRTLAPDAAAVQEIAEEAGLGIFNK